MRHLFRLRNLPALLLLCLLLCGAALAQSYPFTANATASVRIRKTASSTATVLGTVPKGDAVTVTGAYGSYYKVTWNGTSGYILKSYLSTQPAATPTPAVTPEIPGSASGYVVLKQGSTGAAVKALEAALKELGFFSGTPNSVFDSTTAASVKAFQTKNKLTATGTADVNMQAFLYYGKPLNKNGVATQVHTLAPLDSVVMHEGDTGDLVYTVQTRLKELGYYTGAIDGVYSKTVIAAVRTFQKKHNLTADGACGQKTREIMLSANALPAKATATPKATKTPKPTATPKPTSTPSGIVKYGTSGTNARLTQQRLKDLGYFTGTVDGYFGNTSVTALKKFQTAHNQTADGVLGSTTRALLFSANAKVCPTATPKPTATPRATATPMATPTATPSGTVKLNTRGTNATLVQQRLKDLGYYTGTVNGVFNTASVAALKVFQQNNGLTADGIASTGTYRVMFSSSAVPYGGSGSSIPTGKTLRKGSTGSAVKLLQQRLIDLGYLTGTADGSFGAATASAVMLFQRQNGLTADGVAGSTTISRMNSSSAKPMSTATPTPTVRPTATPRATATPKPTATPKAKRYPVDPATVIYANWYTKVRPVVRQYQYATIYDYNTGASWQVHMFSFGNHAEAEPVTSADTKAMEADFGGNTWNPKPVWVMLANGQTYLATMHDMPHGVQHDRDNGFPGHLCIHFPRTKAQVEAIGPYATSHQKAVDIAWEIVQQMTWE